METQVPSPTGEQPPTFDSCLLCPNSYMDQDPTWYGGRPRPSDILLHGELAPPPQNGRAPQFSVHVYCSQSLRGSRFHLVWRQASVQATLCARWGPSSPSTKRGHCSPLFGPCLLCPNGFMDQYSTYYGGRPRPTRYCVRWGPSSPSPKRGQNPQFSADVCCGQTAGWIKMQLVPEVGLGPGRIVTWGPSSPSQQRHSL